MLEKEGNNEDYTVGGKVDLYALEKKRMLEDAAFLDKIINFDASGRVKVIFQTDDDKSELMRRLWLNDWFENETSESTSSVAADD